MYNHHHRPVAAALMQPLRRSYDPVKELQVAMGVMLGLMIIGAAVVYLLLMTHQSLWVSYFAPAW